MKINRSKAYRFFTFLSFAMIAIALLATPVLAAEATATQSDVAATPEGLAEVLLGLVGAALSLAFKYVPSLKAWFESFANKGLLMLAFVVLAGGAYFALSCTPYADQLGIAISCETSSVFVLIRAIAIIATGNQLTHLFAPKPVLSK